MAKQKFSLGPTPTLERAVQTLDPNYLVLAHAECERYVRLLKELYVSAWGSLPPGFSLKVEEKRHDFGVYVDVVAEYDTDDFESEDAALWVANNRPEQWPSYIPRVV